MGIEFISICTNGRHKALKFCGLGKDSGHALAICSRGT